MGYGTSSVQSSPLHVCCSAVNLETSCPAAICLASWRLARSHTYSEKRRSSSSAPIVTFCFLICLLWHALNLGRAAMFLQRKAEPLGERAAPECRWHLGSSAPTHNHPHLVIVYLICSVLAAARLLLSRGSRDPLPGSDLPGQSAPGSFTHIQ